MITAVKWNGDINELKELGATTRQVSLGPGAGQLNIETLEGAMQANLGDYIIKGVAGEIYPCKAAIFERTYDAID